MRLLPAECQPDQASLVRNLNARPETMFGDRQRAVLDETAFKTARRAIASWSGYRPTRLVELKGTAARLGIRSLFYKDESERFALKSFKALGGAYAVERQVEAHGTGITVTCATDGNHGRSVAWGAQRAGCGCVIYIHETVSEGRKRAIEAFGAEVRRVRGNYDDAVREAARNAGKEGWIVVSDTSYEGYTEIPKDVMQGYALMAQEAIEQLPGGIPPSHIFVQGGVGGLAAAVCAQFWRGFGDHRPALIVVEPDNAACLLESARAGKLVALTGDLETVMAGLSCGEPSLIGWEILDEGADWFMTIPDHAAEATMRLLAEGVEGDPPLVAGESAVAGLAGLIALAGHGTWRREIGLDAQSRVLVFGTEGDTDPALYEEIVGRSAAQVRAREGTDPEGKENAS